MINREPDLEVELREITNRFKVYIHMNKLTRSEILLLKDVHNYVIAETIFANKYGTKSIMENI